MDHFNINYCGRVMETGIIVICFQLNTNKSTTKFYKIQFLYFSLGVRSYCYLVVNNNNNNNKRGIIINNNNFFSIVICYK